LSSTSPYCCATLLVEWTGRRVAEDIFDSLTNKKELLALALTFASMIFEGEADQEWLKRRIGMLDDIIRETWFYQDIYQEGKEEGK